MKETSDDTIDEILEDCECYHFFYFSASWCGPCKKLLPLVEEIDRRNTNDKLNFYYVNIDENDKLCSSCDIKQVPSYAVVKDKKLLGIETGSSIEKVGQVLKDCIPQKSDIF
jgi:thioredoxin 1